MNINNESRFRVGTLVYSRTGLVTLFAWLLCGDFVYTLMENVMPVLPLLDQVGKMSAYCGLFGVLIIYPLCILLDHWGSTSQ